MDSLSARFQVSSQPHPCMLTTCVFNYLSGVFVAESSLVTLAPGQSVQTYINISAGVTQPPKNSSTVATATARATRVDDGNASGTESKRLQSEFDAAIARWQAYLTTVMPPASAPTATLVAGGSGQPGHPQISVGADATPASAESPPTGPTAMQWSAVKSVQTLMGNARTVPGLPWTGVLPSYTGFVALHKPHSLLGLPSSQGSSYALYKPHLLVGLPSYTGFVRVRTI